MPDEKAAKNRLNTTTAASLLGITPRYLRSLAEDGHIKQAGRNSWDLVPLVQGYIGFLRSERQRHTKTAQAANASAARTAEIELRIQERRGELIAADAAALAFQQVVGAVVQFTGSLPAALSRDAGERARLTEAISHEQKRLADRFSEIAADAGLAAAED